MSIPFVHCPLSILLVLILTLTGCQTSPQTDYSEDARPIIQELVKELRAIKSCDDLIDAEAKLKPYFNKLAEVMLRSRETAIKQEDSNSELTSEEESQESFLSRQLRIEINRILYMEGGREVIERAQEDALYRLSIDTNN